MRLKLLGIAVLASFFCSTLQAQHYYGWRPDHAGVAPAAYAPGYPPEMGVVPASESYGCTASCGDECECDECCDECSRFALPCWNWQPRGLFLEVEYNMWWSKGRSLPPLVTTSPIGTPFIDAGVLPGATVLFGDDRVGSELGNGGRLTFGKWLDPYQTTALAARFTAFRADDGSFSAVSDGTTNLAIPFIDALSGDESSLIIGYSPDGTTVISQGSVNVEDRLDLTAVEVFGNFLVLDEGAGRFDFFGGYHMQRLDNSLEIGSVINAFGNFLDIRDTFETENEFHGGFIGLMATFAQNRWFFNASGKMSVGNMNQRVRVDGTTIASAGGLVDVRDEGLFAQGTNRGLYTRDKVAYIPEANFKIGYRVRHNMAVTLGYNFLYVSSVAMAGDHIDRTVNLTQTGGGPLIGPARPMFPGVRDTDWWAQGINFGLEVAF